LEGYTRLLGDLELILLHCHLSGKITNDYRASIYKEPTPNNLIIILTDQPTNLICLLILSLHMQDRWLALWPPITPPHPPPPFFSEQLVLELQQTFVRMTRLNKRSSLLHISLTMLSVTKTQNKFGLFICAASPTVGGPHLQAQRDRTSCECPRSGRKNSWHNVRGFSRKKIATAACGVWCGGAERGYGGRPLVGREW